MSTTELRGGPALRLPAHSDWNLYAFSNRRRPYAGEVRFSGTQQEETGRIRLTFAPAATVRPTARVSVTVRPQFVVNNDPAQYLRTQSVSGTRYYLMGELRQRTAITEVRVGYAITPTMSLDVYAQPFASAGEYRAISEVTDAGATRFADRLSRYGPDRIRFDQTAALYRVDRDASGTVDFSMSNPDFAVRQFRLNSVLRWEYRPGSTLFLAWSQSRDDATIIPAFNLADNARQLFGVVPRNVLLLKVSMWRPM